MNGPVSGFLEWDNFEWHPISTDLDLHHWDVKYGLETSVFSLQSDILRVTSEVWPFEGAGKCLASVPGVFQRRTNRHRCHQDMPMHAET